MWNTNKEEGGDKYRLLTSKNNLLTSVYKEHDPNKIMKLIEKETESIKSKCLDRVKYRTSKCKGDLLDTLYKRKNNATDCDELAEVDKKIQLDLKKKRRENLERRMNDMLISLLHRCRV